MGKLSLYRAFRPTSFEQLVRQEHVVRILTNQIQTDAIGHAYLFCGPRGTGKTTVARIFARAVNCEHPQNGSPCGKCATCVALADGGNLDVSEIDAASNNGVNEMRDLREKVQYPPVSGKYKVYIIDEVHMLTDSAFNALLKTLEEPPRHAIFILATTEPHKIPATILSRCMRLDFKLIPEEDLAEHLKRILAEIGKDYEESAVMAIARAGEGSDRDMLSIAEMCLSYSDKLTYEGVTAVLGTADFGQMSELCDAILSANHALSLELTEKFLAQGKSVGVLLRDILRFLNQVTVAKTCKNGEKLLSLPTQLYQKVLTVAQRADGHAILRATEIFSETENKLRFSASPRISLETAMMKASMPATDYDLDALLARISRLEEQIVALSAGKLPEITAQAPIKAPEPDLSPQKAESAEPYFGEFPTEEPVFEEVTFVEPPRAPVPEKKSEPTPPPVAPSPSASTERMTAQVAFGKFIRTLRKTSKSGVLFTLCADLEAEYEGSTLVLYTESNTIFRTLSREEHQLAIKSAFEMIGISDFFIKKKSGEPSNTDKKQGIERLRGDFSDYPVEEK